MTRRTLKTNISEIPCDPGLPLLKQHGLPLVQNTSQPIQMTSDEHENAKSDHQKMIATIRERNQRLQKMNTELENELRALVEDRVRVSLKNTLRNLISGV